MLLFVDTDLFPGGETLRERPAVNYEANAMKDGNTGILQAPESGGKRVWVAEWRGRGGHHGSDRRRSEHGDVGGWGKILSRGEQRIGRGIV